MADQSQSNGNHWDPIQCAARAIVRRRLGPFMAAGPSDELLRDSLADAEAVLASLVEGGWLSEEVLSR